MCNEESGTNFDTILIEDVMIDKVTAIQGHTDLLLERHAKDPRSLKWLSSIRKATEDLAKLINQLRQERQQQ